MKIPYSKVVVLSAFLMALAFASCNDEEKESGRDDWEEIDRTASRVNAFGISLFKQLTVGNKANVVMSPVGIASSLSAVSAGANGNSCDELTATVKAGSMTPAELMNLDRRLCDHMRDVSDKVSLHLASSIWTESGIDLRPDFIRAVSENGEHDLMQYEISSGTTLDRINGWYSEKTHDATTGFDILPFDNDSRFNVVSIASYSGKWFGKGFDKALTAPADFMNADGSVSRIPFMTDRDRSFQAAHDDSDVTLFSMIYAEGGFRILFIAADKENPESLERYISALDWGHIMWDIPDWEDYKGEISIPKLDLACEIRLDDALKAIGTKSIFTQHADFSNMTDEWLCLDGIFHKSCFSTSEDGYQQPQQNSGHSDKDPVIEGSGAFPGTEKAMDFALDRPFAFFVYETYTDALIMAGHVTNL